MISLKKIYFLSEANKSGKTEHSGSKKGKGAYWGRKKDAKKESKKVRRNNDKEEALKTEGSMIATDDDWEQERHEEIDIPYDAYSVLQQYWYGQGDPLYAVLSRYKGRPMVASESEIDRLYDAAEDAIANNEDLTDEERFELLDFSSILSKLMGYEQDQ